MSNDLSDGVELVLLLLMSIPLLAVAVVAIGICLLFVFDATAFGYTASVRDAFLALFVLVVLPVDVLGSGDE